MMKRIAKAVVDIPEVSNAQSNIPKRVGPAMNRGPVRPPKKVNITPRSTPAKKTANKPPPLKK